MLVCPTCGTEDPDGAKFCNGCGTALAQAEPRRLLVEGAAGFGEIGVRIDAARAFLFESVDGLTELDA